MAVIKCKMCGGTLALTEGSTIAQCEYCGRVQTVPALDDEKKLIQFERAERLRKQCEFDKAAGVYESIVADFHQEAEAYWGLVLCKYGIEYVDDPATGKKIPTCHRSSFNSIMEDEDFEQTLENADTAAKKLYREEAKTIEDLRKGIISVSAQEDPYDIFICYKETDKNGNRTLDSVLAQNIYDALTEKKYRVFFARITLEDKLGQEYEPYIFAALNSAKIMLAIGTDYEYYNAVWVKNEWSRYLELIANGEKKTLIPCYKGIEAYDMPKEFAHLQAQDMGKVGAIQDLLRGIEKLISPESKVSARNIPSAEEIAPLVKRVFFSLEDGDWANAAECCEQILMADPENAEANLGKLMIALKCCKKQDLQDRGVLYLDNNNYQRAIRFGSQELKAELVEFATRNTYQYGLKQMQNASTAAEYRAIADAFQSISDYRDAAQKIQECHERMVVLQEEETQQAQEQKKKATKKRVMLIAALTSFTALLVAFLIALFTVIIPNNQYNKACALRESGNYSQAIEAFTELGNYKDAQAQIYAIYYAQGEALRASGDYAGAVEAFTNAGEYEDAQAQIYATYYAQGEALRASGDDAGAVEAFTNAGEYEDAQVQIFATYYAQGDFLIKSKDHEGALAAFAASGDYMDAKTRLAQFKTVYGTVTQRKDKGSTFVYKYTYREDGQVLTEEFTNIGNYGTDEENYAETATKTYTYDAKGILVGIQTTDSFGSVEQEHCDLEGRVVKKVDSSGTYYYTYDSQGRLTEDGYGRKYSYDERGRLATIEGFDFDPYIIQCSYDDADQLIKRELIREDGSVGLTEVFHYDDKGNLIKEEDIYISGYTETMEYTYEDPTLVYVPEKA